MSTLVSFTSLPREIRDQIYKEVLVYSEHEHMIYTAHPHGHPIKEGHGLYHPAFSNQQIAREAYEAYYGCNTFTADVVLVSAFLASKIDLGGEEWFFPAAYVRKISITTTYFGSFMSSLDLNPRELSLSCPKLRTIILESFAKGTPVDYFLSCAKLIHVKNIVFLGRKLKNEVSNIKLELYLHGFCYLRDHASEQYFGTFGHCTYLDRTENVSWLIDEPDQQMIEKVENGQGSAREWLVVQMATKWAPIGKEHGEDWRIALMRK